MKNLIEKLKSLRIYAVRCVYSLYTHLKFIEEEKLKAMIHSGKPFW